MSDKHFFDSLESLNDLTEVRSVHWVAIPASLHDHFVLCWAVRWNPTNVWPHILVDDLGHDLVWSETFERWLTRHDLPHDDGEGVDICLVTIVSITLKYFGSHPMESAS